MKLVYLFRDWTYQECWTDDFIHEYFQKFFVIKSINLVQWYKNRFLISQTKCFIKSRIQAFTELHYPRGMCVVFKSFQSVSAWNIMSKIATYRLWQFVYVLVACMERRHGYKPAAIQRSFEINQLPITRKCLVITWHRLLLICMEIDSLVLIKHQLLGPLRFFFSILGHYAFLSSFMSTWKNCSIHTFWIIGSIEWC